MFGTIRKHQSWLWFIIIAVMVLSMIVWQNQLGKNGNGQSATGNFGSIYDKAITAAEYTSAQNEASLEFLTRYKQWPGSPGTPAGTNVDNPAAAGYNLQVYPHELTPEKSARKKTPGSSPKLA